MGMNNEENSESAIGSIKNEELRNEKRIQIASVIILVGFTMYDLLSYNFIHPYVAMFSFFKGIILLSIALISGYIGKRAKRLIIQNYKEQKEKAVAGRR